MSKMSNKWENNEEIQLFREYLRIPSVHPDPDYEPCIKFLKKQAENLGLPMKVHYPSNPKKPVAVITWTGMQTELPSILLNSHMDVVPVFEENWTHPPFDAEIDNEGKIFGRGSQDMKSVGMQYLAAVRALKRKGVHLKRTIHILFVPDEEIGGPFGMKEFVLTNEFKSLNVGFSLDEGVAFPADIFPLFYAERTVWHLFFKISGTTGHGSLLLKNTAGEKLNYMLQKMFTFREDEVKRLESNPELLPGDITSINLTQIRGGVQSNVVPPMFMAGFDVRIAIDVDLDAFEKKLKQWCEEAGGGIEIEYEQKDVKVEPTKIDSTNPYWVALKKTADELGLTILPLVCPGGTDSQYLRKVGVKALGFSPMNNTPTLLHDHDEYLTAETYLRGIEIYMPLISAVADF